MRSVVTGGQQYYPFGRLTRAVGRLAHINMRRFLTLCVAYNTLSCPSVVAAAEW